MSLGLSLFVVLVAAKAIAVASLDAPNLFALPAYVWQDAAAATAFTLITRPNSLHAVRCTLYAVSCTLYAAICLLAIVNVPVMRALGSPITAPMLNATGGALSDSLRHYATFGNVASVAILSLLACALPFVRVRARQEFMHGRRVWGLGAVLVLGGFAANTHIETHGLERNTLVAFAATAVQRVSPAAGANDADWRASIAEAAERAGPSEDLSYLSGVAKRRNVLLIVLESTAARYLRAYGSAHDPTPNLTAFASRAVLFENAYAVYPESVRGMLALFASRYPAFDIPTERQAGAIAPSIASVLDSAGYATALFHSGRFMYLGMDTLVSRSGFGLAEDAGDIGGNRESSFGIDESAAVARVLQWIDSVPKGTPFFAAYLPVAGHHPYAYSGAGQFPDTTDAERYLNALHEGDRALGELLRGLVARTLDSTTLVVIAGDHGEAFGQHVGNYGHTLAIYDENVKVPLLFWTRDIEPRRVRRVASLIDVAPTILDLLGAAAPRDFQGASLLDASERMALFFADYSLPLLGLRDGCMKVIHDLSSERSRVFNVCRDPDEQSPMESDHLDAYEARLLGWSRAQVARSSSAER